ncbi:hypothetical protein NE237_025230 [Protea cynaroides]|uniref:Uncharacterized protein n=1 Tax=Protea cynaroides TaxID=273540 RepID=A0A9Q0H6P1_9MAGN|nr:hypothetical protein NE237_025230 [Protea cynaroides]
MSKDGSGLAMPVRLKILWLGAGIGREDQHKKKQRREEVMEKMKTKKEGALMAEFGSRQKSHWRSRKIVGSFNKVKGALEVWNRKGLNHLWCLYLLSKRGFSRWRKPETKGFIFFRFGKSYITSIFFSILEKKRNPKFCELIQVEKELQSRKSLLLESKLSNIRSMEQRCLMLDQKNAVLNFKILGHRSEISHLEAKYQSTFQQFRNLKSEVEEHEEYEKKKDRLYEMKRCDMEDFKGQVQRFVFESHQQVQDLRLRLDGEDERGRGRGGRRRDNHTHFSLFTIPIRVF